ncbi:hypothetical protein ACHAXN_008755 [Cyclotella atomus]
MNEAQIAFLVLYAAYIVIIFIFHNTIVCYPFRLLTTFLHELSHAIACWITCGDVHKIRVFDNEGGVTQYVGGCRLLVIPAGYVGSAMWGSLFVMLSGGRKTATGVAGTLVGMLLWSLCYSPNKTMVYLNLFYAIFTSVFIYLEWWVFSPILNYVVLFYGVFVGIHAIFDTYQDTLRRTVLHSDAYACYEQKCNCCLPKCIGMQWAIINIVLQLFGVWVALVQMTDECNNKDWMECLSGDLAWDSPWDMNVDQVYEWSNQAKDMFN